MGVEKKAEQRLVGFGRAKARQAIFFDEPKTMRYRIVFLRFFDVRHN